MAPTPEPSSPSEEPPASGFEHAFPGALRCQKESSLRSLVTRVVACEEVVVVAPGKTKKPTTTSTAVVGTNAVAERFFEVELLDTVLFPEGGGQPWDTGRINDTVVDKVYVKDGRCVHRVPVSAAARDAVDSLSPRLVPPFAVGEEVVAVVDWERRFDHMQQHSAQHLLSAIAARHGYETTTWSLGEERNNVELVATATATATAATATTSTTVRSSKGIPAETLLQIETEVNEAIVRGLAMTPTFATPGSAEYATIASKFSADATPATLRVVCIEGLDANPCCGTHVTRLSQLQSVRLLHAEAARGGATRVWFVAGERVHREFARMFRREQAMGKLLSCGPDEHASRVEKLISAQKAAAKELKSMQQELAASVAAELVAQSVSTPVVWYHRVPSGSNSGSGSGGDLSFLQAVLAHVGDAKERAVFVLAAGDVNSECPFVLAGPVPFVLAHGRDAAQVIDGKGGGKNGVFQGKAKGLGKLDALVVRLTELCLSA